MHATQCSQWHFSSHTNFYSSQTLPPDAGTPNFSVSFCTHVPRASYPSGTKGKVAELRHQSKGKQAEKWVDLGLQTSWHGCFLNRRKVGAFSTLSTSDVVRLGSFARAPLATTKVFNPQRIPEPLHKSTWGTVHGSEVSTVSAHCRSQDGSSQPNQSCWRS